MNAPVEPVATVEPGLPQPAAPRTTGSLTRRMIGAASLWIFIMLVVGGVGLDRVLVSSVKGYFDQQLDYVLNAMLTSAEIGPNGEVRLSRPLDDQRFIEPNSGAYWQVAGGGFDPFTSSSLWDRTLKVRIALSDGAIAAYDSREFPETTLRVIQRDVKLPNSQVTWHFQVAEDRGLLTEQIRALRRVLLRSFALLGLGLMMMAALQASYGLWPLRRVRRAIAAVRSGRAARVDIALPEEIAPMAGELNALLAHNEIQAEEARRHAGNLAHALKTPLTVIMNEATANSADLCQTVIREATTMRRQVDHHLARARAVGRRGLAQSRSEVWPSLQAVERAVGRMHRHVTIDLDGDRQAAVRVERQDLDELLGNLIENAAKYGGSRVFVTVVAHPAPPSPPSSKADAEPPAGNVEIIVEDDGRGIPEDDRAKLFERGARLDTGKPGTGLGLAIVRDVSEIYGGSVTLDESEDLGGLLVRLTLPAAAQPAG